MDLIIKSTSIYWVIALWQALWWFLCIQKVITPGVHSENKVVILQNQNLMNIYILAHINISREQYKQIFVKKKHRISYPLDFKVLFSKTYFQSLIIPNFGKDVEK